MAGYQNNPLTKFPLSVHPPGQVNTNRPGTQAPMIQHSPIGPVVHGTPTQVTPLGARTKTFSGFKNPLANK